MEVTAFVSDPTRQKLCELIARFGPALCNEPRQCEGLLRDACGEDRRKIRLLSFALKEKMPAELLAMGKSMPAPLLVGRLTKKLQDDLALTEEAARWAIESWALALGVISPRQLPPEISQGASPIQRAITPSVPASPNPVPVSSQSSANVTLSNPPSPRRSARAAANFLTNFTLARILGTAPRSRGRGWMIAAGVITTALLALIGYNLLVQSRQIALPEARTPAPGTRARTPQINVSHPARGPRASLAAAIARAAPGSRVRIAPGTYFESIVLDKPLELIGDGPVGSVIIQSVTGDCLLINTDEALVRNLTLRTVADTSGSKFFAVNIVSGHAVLENCDISCGALAAVGIHGASANPTLRRCAIHDSKAAGVFIYDQARATIEDCEIFGNATAGIAISKGADPILKGCRLHGGQSSGVFVYDGGKGRIENCDIRGHTFAQIEIKAGGDPTVRASKIRDGKAGGVFVYAKGRGTLEDCDIVGNALAGIEIKEGGTPTVRHCRINANGGAAVDVHDGGSGSIEHCDLRRSRYAWNIQPNSAIRRYMNTE